MTPLRIGYAVTVPITAAAFLQGHLRDLHTRGHHVWLACHPEPRCVVDTVRLATGVDFHPITIRREISPKQDVASLWAFYRLLRRLRPQVMNVGTPKAGLLCGLAGVAARVPVRIYTLHGLRSETAAFGMMRRLRPLLLACDWLACLCAHTVVCVSPSNRDEAVALRIVPSAKTRVLGSGSATGVDVQRWASGVSGDGLRVRRVLGLADDAPVAGFVGRLVPQKGVDDLLEAWELVHASLPSARLLLVGDLDPVNPLSSVTLKRLAKGHARGIVRVSFLDDLAPLYATLDVLTLPSKHEGLGMVLLEAAAAGVATVVTDSPGVRDAVLPGQSGLMVTAGDVRALGEALGSLLQDRDRAAEMGQQGRCWVAEYFAQERVWHEWALLYEELWAERGKARRPSKGTASASR